MYSLTLERSVYPEHDGKYACVARNPFGVASKLLTVNVKGRLLSIGCALNNALERFEFVQQP